MIFVTDAEVAPNFFCCTFMNYLTKEKFIFELSERQDDSKDFYKFYSSLKKRKDRLISFNGNHYDLPIYEQLSYLLRKKDNILTILDDLDKFSYHIINTDFWWKEKQLKRFKYPKGIVSVDLMLYWSRMLRISKKISLKSLGIQLGYHTVQELPYEPNTPIPIGKMDDVIHYNSVHDLDITWLLAKQMEKDIILRHTLKKKYNFNCMSWDAPKIGMSLLKKFYKDKTGKDLDISVEHAEIALGQILLGFEFKENKTYSKNHRNYYSLFKKIEDEVVFSTKGIKENVFIENSDESVLHSVIASGGIHGVSNVFPGILEPKDDEVILDADIASMYPNLIILLQGLGDCLPIYQDILNDRLEAKKLRKDTSLTQKQRDDYELINSTYKLILNSVYGMLGNEYSGIANLKDQLSVTINGQLLICEITEKLVNIGVNVHYQNTDGLTMICKKHQLDNVYKIFNQCTQKYPTIVWEFEQFKKMCVKDVNNFINITENGKIKKKGSFVYDKPLGDSVNFLVIPKALEAYYINNINPEEFIKNHNNIHDFCGSLKCSKSFNVYWNGDKQQRLNRFYPSTKGFYLYKSKDGKSFHHMNKESGVKLWNNISSDEIPKDLNFQWYLSKINKIINTIVPKQLKLNL